MEKAKVSVIQLFSLMFIFNMGTALVVGYGIEAGKDAWLAILLGTCGGIILFIIYYLLFRQYPNLPFTGMVKKVLGKYVGWIIGLLYIMYFLYISARNLRDFGELLLSSTLTDTPLLAVQITFVLVMCYVLYLGIEVLGRTAEVLIVILLLFGAAGNFLTLVSGNVEFQHLRPFLENGWKPILQTALLTTTPFPFGEMIVFTMILPYLNKSEVVKRVWLSAIILSGLILCWTTSLNISVLGIDVMERATFPTLTTVGKVNILDFIQRLDALVVFTMLITVFFKSSIFLYGAVLGLVDLFKLKSHQQILLPTGGILIFFSSMMATNFSDHIEEGRNALRYFHIPIVFIVPLIILLVSLIRKWLKNNTN